MREWQCPRHCSKPDTKYTHFQSPMSWSKAAPPNQAPTISKHVSMRLHHRPTTPGATHPQAQQPPGSPVPDLNNHHTSPQSDTTTTVGTAVLQEERSPHTSSLAKYNAILRTRWMWSKSWDASFPASSSRTKSAVWWCAHVSVHTTAQ